METVLVSSTTAVIVAAVAAFGTWLSVRGKASVDRASALALEAENLRRGLIEEIQRLGARIMQLEAENAKLEQRIQDLERENWRLLRNMGP